MSGPERLRLEHTDAPGRGLRLIVSGEIDLVTAPELMGAVALSIGDHVTPLLVDLSAVTLLDSFGLSVLVRASSLARAAGVELRVERSSPSCRRVFERASIADMLTIVD
jgi:anti-sigma B factor antagonist